MGSKRALCFTTLTSALVVVGCGSGEERRFPLRDVLWLDTDLRGISIDCEVRPSEKDPKHVACAPRPYVSPLAWDGIDNSIFRPLSNVFAVDPAREAPNVNAFDEIPDSAWFTNRLGKKKPSIAELVRGACMPDEVLDADKASPGSFVVDHGKDNGASLGFRIKVGKRKYMMKTDVKEQPERPSAASAIGAAIYHAVGYNTSCEQVVFVDPKSLKLTPGLKVTNNAGVTKAFDQKSLDAVLASATQRGDRVRLQASGWLPGYLIGPFRYEKTRDDDPNDAIAHEDRRDLRGARVLAAWLNHFDAREQNSMDSWIADKHDGEPDLSPGHVRHYYLDTSDCLGSEWDWDGISRRLGNSYLLDWGDIGQDFITLGIPMRPWDRMERVKGMEMFGYFPTPEFDPAGWKNEYPNPAFSRASERDNAWMARILSRLDRDDIHALAELGKFADPRATEFLTDVLERRLEKIVARYLLRLSPVTDVRVVAPSTICATDLARRRHVRDDNAFRYVAKWRNQGRIQGVAVESHEAGEICMTLPSTNVDSSVADDAASRYVVVTIMNGASTHPLRAHFYDLGAKGGYRLVGMERREDSNDP